MYIIIRIKNLKNYFDVQRTFALPQFTAQRFSPYANKSLYFSLSLFPSVTETVARATWRKDFSFRSPMLPSTYTLHAPRSTYVQAHRRSRRLRRDRDPSDLETSVATIIRSGKAILRGHETPLIGRRNPTAPVALASRPFPAEHPFSQRCRAPWRLASPRLTNRTTSRARLPLTAVILIELVQRLEPGDRRLVYRKLPRHILAGLPRGLLPGSARLLPPAFLPAALRYRPGLLARRGLGVCAAMVRGVLARVAATRTLGSRTVR